MPEPFILPAAVLDFPRMNSTSSQMGGVLPRALPLLLEDLIPHLHTQHTPTVQHKLRATLGLEKKRLRPQFLLRKPEIMRNTVKEHASCLKKKKKNLLFRAHLQVPVFSNTKHRTEADLLAFWGPSWKSFNTAPKY